MHVEELTEEERAILKTPVWEMLAAQGGVEVEFDDPVEAGMLAGQLKERGMPLLGALDIWVESEVEGVGPYYVIIEVQGGGLVVA